MLAKPSWRVFRVPIVRLLSGWDTTPLPRSQGRCFCTKPEGVQKSPPSLLKQLQDQIRMTGALSIQQYMRACLIHPRGGYYTQGQVFGEHGDYITSPEVSQMFGEMLAVWVYSEWHKMGQEKPLRLVEFGPGTGSLMADLLRVLGRLGLRGEALSVHLVERSPHMRQRQRELLCQQTDVSSSPRVFGSVEESVARGLGCRVCWHDKLDTVPEGFTMMVANEFLDALPIHRFVKVGGEWKEILVDVNDKTPAYSEVDVSPEQDQIKPNQVTNDDVTIKSIEQDSKSNQDTNSNDAVKEDIKSNDVVKEDIKSVIDNLALRFVLSRNQTPASIAFTQDLLPYQTEVEICPEAEQVAADMAARITNNGGAVLLVDYGHLGERTDTLRSFQRHKEVHPLTSPGLVDLTADVDFSRIRRRLPDSVLSLGPITQKEFLNNMGIQLRLMKLLKSNQDDAAKIKTIRTGYERLVSDLGRHFKVMALYPKVMAPVLGKHPSPGFPRQEFKNGKIIPVEESKPEATEPQN